ncbi:hypothetical protein DFP72DRAFT_881238, partial [Ephemerocybe angulata]
MAPSSAHYPVLLQLPSVMLCRLGASAQATDRPFKLIQRGISNLPLDEQTIPAPPLLRRPSHSQRECICISHLPSPLQRMNHTSAN